MFLCPWNFPSKNTGVGCHSLFQEIFPTQEWNPGILHCRQILYCLSHSVQFSRSIVSDSWWPHGLQHTRPPCPSPSPGACSNSCPFGQRCHPTISSSVIPFSSCPQSFPASGSFPISWLFTSGGQSIRASVSASALPMNIQGWFPLGLTGLISLLSKEFSRVFSRTTIWKHQLFSAQSSLWSNSHIFTWLLEKPQLWLDGPLLAKWCLCFLIHCHSFPFKEQVSFNFVAAVIIHSDLEPKKIKSVTAFTFPPSICHAVMGPDVMILVLWIEF